MENKCYVPFLLLSVWDLWALMQKEFISEPYTHWWFFVIPLVSNAIISFAFCCSVAVESNSTTYTVQNLATYVLLFILHPFIVGMFLYCLRSRIYFLNHFGHWTFSSCCLLFLNYPPPFCIVRLQVDRGDFLLMHATMLLLLQSSRKF